MSISLFIDSPLLRTYRHGLAISCDDPIDLYYPNPNVQRVPIATIAGHAHFYGLQIYQTNFLIYSVPMNFFLRISALCANYIFNGLHFVRSTVLPTAISTHNNPFQVQFNPIAVGFIVQISSVISRTIQYTRTPPSLPQ